MSTVPDFPPPPKPGDLVLWTYERYGLTQNEWERWQRDFNRWAEENRIISTAATETGYGSPFDALADNAEHAGCKRRAIGDPTAFLWQAYSRELKLMDEIPTQ